MQYTVEVDVKGSRLTESKLHMLAIECCCDTYGVSDAGGLVFVFDDKQDADDFNFFVAAETCRAKKKASRRKK